jgi:hypothetical protein
MFLLFDHLYSALRFEYIVSEKYDALRTIKLKKVELKADAKESYICQITLYANTTETSPISDITFTQDPSAGTMSYQSLYSSTDLGAGGDPLGEKVLDHTTPQGFMGGFVPGDNLTFTLRTTYDVYDKSGNKTRSNQMSENVLNMKNIFIDQTSWLNRGTYYTVRLKVDPTYLYVLSDPDLDNPTVVVN